MSPADTTPESDYLLTFDASHPALELVGGKGLNLAILTCQVYGDLGAPPVAVRSSATAEDLSEMSFAGQQDTYLNVQGADALIKAVRECWSSLWTACAIGYRARNGIDHDDVALAVIVQEMVQSAAAGVLFTANPLNGKRGETVIGATLLQHAEQWLHNAQGESDLVPEDLFHLHIWLHSLCCYVTRKASLFLGNSGLGIGKYFINQLYDRGLHGKQDWNHDKF